MKMISANSRYFVALTFVGLIVLFQNCGPATLKGSNDEASLILPSVSGQPSAVGSKVDLDLLLTSPQENASNILFPSATTADVFDYAENAPIIENLVLLNSDFNSIQWVHAPTATVVATGMSFNQMTFSPEMLGTYYIFGYRGGRSYLIGQFSLVNRQGSTLGVNSANAVAFNQRSVVNDGVEEILLVSVNAPAVDLASVQFVLKNTGQSISGQRAILIRKKLAEAVDIEATITDMSGGVLTQLVTLPANLSPSPTSSPTPATPTPTPTPTPVSTPTPGPTFVKGVNLNGPQLVVNGKTFLSEADAGATNDGSTMSKPLIALSPATDAATAELIHSAVYKFTPLTIRVPVTNGSYQVYIYTWEDTLSVTYSVTVEGVLAASNLASGSPGAWRRLGPYAASVSDGTLTIVVTGGVNVSAIEIYSP